MQIQRKHVCGAFGLLLFGASGAACAVEIFAGVDGSATSYLAPSDQDQQSADTTSAVNLGVLVTSGDPGTPEVYTRHYSGASANAGSAGVVVQSHASGTYNLGSGQAPTASGNAYAGFTIDDLVFSGLGTLVDVSLNIDVSGNRNYSINPGSSGVVITSSSFVDVDVSFGRAQTQSTFDGRQSNSVRQDGFDPPNDSYFEDGDLIGVGFPTTITLDPLTVVVGHVYSLTVSLRVSSLGRLGGIPNNTHTGEVTTSALFGSTASLPTSGPVFTMAPGFSVSSASAGITDNAWGGTPVSVSVIPLPASVWVFLSGAAFIARRRTRPVRGRAGI